MKQVPLTPADTAFQSADALIDRIITARRTDAGRAARVTAAAIGLAALGSGLLLLQFFALLALHPAAAIAGAAAVSAILAGTLTWRSSNESSAGLRLLGTAARDLRAAPGQPFPIAIAPPAPAGSTGAGRQAIAALQAELALAQAERDRAERAERATSQYLVRISHELRTPLNAILGYSVLLEEDMAAAGNVSAQTDLGRISLAGQHLHGLLNDFLDLATANDSDQKAAHAIVDVKQLLESIAEQFPGKDERTSVLAIDLAPGAELMVGDAGRIKQCLVAILRAHRADRITDSLGVSLRVAPVSGSAIQFIISHTLFPDMTSEAGTHLTQSWIGLTTRLAENLGGTVGHVNEGASAATTLTLPINAIRPHGEFEAKTTTAPAPRILAPAQTDAARRKALVIDDHKASLDLMERWLVPLGFDVLTAVDGQSGLALAREVGPDLIILDIHLPDISGFEVMSMLRDDERTRAMPVIIVSVDDDRERGLRLGASEYLRKPATRQAMTEILATYSEPGTGNVLLIEDDDDAAAIVSRCAEHVGLTVRRAVDGLQGIDFAIAERPSAIVLDLNLPRADGYAVIDYLTRDERLRDVPVIVMSAADVSVEQYRAIQNAGYRFSIKGSLSPRELASRLKEMAA